MNYISKSLIRWRDFWKVAEIAEIARRYFILNIFDGILAVLGIVIASFFAGIYEARIIIAACLGAAIAITASGISGGYLTEDAERKSKVKELGRKVYLNLEKSPIGRAHRFATIFLALVNGMSPLVAILIIILPFFLVSNVLVAYYTSMTIAFLMLFFVGMFLGKINKIKGNMLYSGVRMLIVGVICVIILFLIGKL